MLLSSLGAQTVSPYDPLAVRVPGEPSELCLSVTDDGTQRTRPIRVVLPTTTTPCAVLLFSHGLGGSCEGNAHLLHWVARGYGLVYLQHPGSDTAVWEGVPARQRLAAMQAAASATNFAHRIVDVRSVLDALDRWNREDGHALFGRLDLTRVGMSGHSFGAVTTQAVSGQRFGTRSFSDARIRAALAFSPSVPRGGITAHDAFAAVTIPWLLMTGTHDNSLIGDQDAASRQQVFSALPAAGCAYELVLDRAEHSAFTDRALPGDRLPRNPQHHRAIVAISTAFWDATLAGDAQAKAWLDGEGPRTVLAEADRWQRK